MLQGWILVIKLVFISAIAGAGLGVFVGALTDQYLLWLGIMAAVGAGFGFALAYGFLPEKET